MGGGVSRKHMRAKYLSEEEIKKIERRLKDRGYNVLVEDILLLIKELRELRSKYA
jgi:ribosomal protein S13